MGRQRRRCSEATLRGTYLFRDQGVDETGRTFAGAGYEYFDGKGHSEGVFSHHDYGERSAHNARYSGTYTVNANCTGTATYPEFGEFDLFIDPEGHTFMWVQTRPRRSEGVSGVYQRVAQADLTSVRS